MHQSEKRKQQHQQRDKKKSFIPHVSYRVRVCMHGESPPIGQECDKGGNRSGGQGKVKAKVKI
jgi:Fe-S-cluster-containing dehydrogenase component